MTESENLPMVGDRIRDLSRPGAFGVVTRIFGVVPRILGNTRTLGNEFRIQYRMDFSRSPKWQEKITKFGAESWGTQSFEILTREDAVASAADTAHYYEAITQ